MADPHNLKVEHTGDPGGLARIALNLELPPPQRAAQWLAHLQAQQVIWDPLPARVLLLRALGLEAFWLDPQARVNGWLQQPAAADPAAWSRRLGLAPVEAGSMVVLGPGGGDWDRALAEEASQPPGMEPVPPLAYLPGWPDLLVVDLATALAQAGWLAATAAVADSLAWIGIPQDSVCMDLPVQQLVLNPPLTPAELRAELAGRPLQASAEDRLTPPLDILLSWEQPGSAPQAAVLVSLFNYADRIRAALDSVAAQSQAELELIVVDDASTDHGVAVVKAWMHDQLANDAHPFVRVQLLRHTRNAGLATARNTAFETALAPWCFVLDADNALYPQAVSSCLVLAQAGSPQLAVVHPLIAVAAEPGRSDDQRTLVRPQSWQQERFRFENHVDAMALVRRSAWQEVGGYTHIEGGWEDYDFWCKLVGAGFHGLQCPRVLAVYCSHASSMSHAVTNHSWRALTRTLQQRHPWLQLPLAR